MTGILTCVIYSFYLPFIVYRTERHLCMKLPHYFTIFTEQHRAENYIKLHK